LRFNILSAGRRWRKSSGGMSIGVEGALMGQQIFCGAPTFDQVRIVWNETKKAAGGVANFTQQRMTAEFPTGGLMLFRSLDDPDNARGHTADGVLIDEAGDVKPSAWYEVIRPILIDTGGWAWLRGTPKGRNWFWREYMAAQDRDDSMAWQAPTLGCEIVDGGLVRKPHPLENPNISFEEILDIFETTPIDIFRQEILAEFIEHEGAVFRNIQACLNAAMNAVPDDHKGHQIVAGVDWARQHDFSVVCIGCVTCHQELALDRYNQVQYIIQRDRMKAAFEKWGVQRAMIELNAVGLPNFELLQQEGLPVIGFETTPKSKGPLIQSLALAFEREEWQFLNIPVATGELEAYEQKVSPTTHRVSYSAPEGLHDDTVIARALMLEAAGGKIWLIS
jgi:hypothetical protein